MNNTIYLILHYGASLQTAYTTLAPQGFIARGLQKRTGLDVKCIYSNTAHEMRNVAGIISMQFDYFIQSELQKYPTEKCFLLSYEPPIIEPNFYHPEIKKTFGKIFVPSDDFVDNQHFIKLPYPGWHPLAESIPSFEEKKFCILINSNKSCSYTKYELYSERRNTINNFTQFTNEFDLYGSGWDGIASWRGVWSGDVPSLMKNYKFSICYENMRNQNGYISEKIFNAIATHCVPVYWGAANITDYVPKECFIDRRNFSSDQELYQFLMNVNKETFQKYIEAQEEYINTPKAKIFTCESGAEIILDHFEKAINLYTARG